MLEGEFNAGTIAVKVGYWACSREENQNDDFHYNCALKAFESYLSKSEKVNCRISCCLCHKKKVHRRRIFLWFAKKRKSLSNLDLAEFIREGGIKSYTEFLAIDDKRRTAVQMHVADFVFKRNEKKILREFVTKTWQIEEAKEKLEASKAS